MEGIKSSIKEKKQCVVSVQAEVSKEVLNKKLEEVFVEIQDQAEVPGFRKGKAPIDTIKQNYQQNAQEKLVRDIVPVVVTEVIQKEKLNPIVYPSVNDLKYSEDGSMVFTIVVELAPEFQVKDYKGVKLETQNAEVTDDEVDSLIGKYREQTAKMLPDDSDVVTKQSFVTIDYEGKLEGQAFKGGSATNRMLSIEQSQFIPGFAEGIVGMKKDETKDVIVTFPSEYQEKDLAGKEVVFTITVHDIKKRELPNLDDEFAKTFGLESLQKMKDTLKENIFKDKEYRVKQELEDNLITKLVENNKISVPPTLVEERVKGMIERAKQYMAQNGAAGNNVNIQDDTLREKYLEQAEKYVKASFILHAIADKEKLDISEEDFTKHLEEAVNANKDNEKTIREYYDKNKDKVIGQLKEDKLFNFLKDNAKIKEVANKKV